MSNPSLEEVRTRLEPAGPDVLDGHAGVEILESVEPSDTELVACNIYRPQSERWGGTETLLQI